MPKRHHEPKAIEFNFDAEAQAQLGLTYVNIAHDLSMVEHILIS